MLRSEIIASLRKENRSASQVRRTFIKLARMDGRQPDMDRIEALVRELCTDVTPPPKRKPKTLAITGHVYRITNTATGWVYIGSSVDVKTRIKTHIRELTSGHHINKNLQAAWDKCGSDCFEVDILAEVPYRDLLQEEFRITDATPNTYNIDKNGRVRG